MRRLGRVGIGVVAAGWLGVVGAQSLGDPVGRLERRALLGVALLTSLGHLGLGWTLRSQGRGIEARPGWVAVQAERYRTLAAGFAAWGLGALTLTAGLVPPSPAAPGGLLPLASGLNLGLQPGLLLAEGWAIMARSRLVAGTSAANST